MSILSSLFHHEIHDLPNDAHNIPETENTTPPNNQIKDDHLSGNAKKQLNAMKSKSVKPAMFYSEDVRRPCKNGAWQDDHAVESALEHREETPRG